MKPLFTWRSAISDSELPSVTRHVALALSLYMSERGDSAFPGATRLSRDTGLSVRAVRTHLSGLVEAGWLVLDHRGGQRGEARTANTYRAVIPNGGTTVTGEPESPVNVETLTPAPDDTDPCTTFTPTLQELSKNSPSAPKREKDLIFEAVIEVCGLDAQQLTKSARGAVNGACKQLRDVGADDELIRRKAETYRVSFPTASLTPSALVKHWPALGAAPPKRDTEAGIVRVVGGVEQRFYPGTGWI